MPNKEEKFNELWGGIIDPKIKSYSTESEIWEEFPVDIGTFIDSPDFLDWKKNIYYGVRKNLENIFVFDKNYDLKYNHAIIIESPGTGKSEFSAIASMYMVYRMLCMRNPQRFYGIAPGSRIQIVNCSSSGTQAKKVVFDYAKSKADSMKWLKDREYLPNPRVESELQFPKGIYITPGSSDRKSVV